LLAGVQGSGKSWVCEQLRHRYTYVPHDDYLSRPAHIAAIERIAKTSSLPVLADTPFATQAYRDRLPGLELVAIYERPEVLDRRWAAGGRQYHPEQVRGALTRQATYRRRAVFSGTSNEVLGYLNR
jgi:hypothetical protein